MRISRVYGAAAVMLFALAAGTATAQPAGPARRPPPQASPGFISPAGLLYQGSDPVGAWWRAADADGDGALSEAELAADFERAAQALDGNRDGRLTTQEIRAYDQSIQAQMGDFFAPVRTIGGPRPEPERPPGGPGGPRPGGPPGGPPGAGGPRPDADRPAPQPRRLPFGPPSMLAADLNGDEVLSQGERAALAHQVFARMAQAVPGRITMTALVAAPPPAADNAELDALTRAIRPSGNP